MSVPAESVEFTIPSYFTDAIQVVEGALPAEQCRELINRFEADPSSHITHNTPGYAFTELRLDEHWPEASALLRAELQHAALGYAFAVGTLAWWQRPVTLSSLRIKRYRPGTGERFPPHLDVRDRASSVRRLAMIVYLNDVEEGGETGFPQWGIAVRPETGKLLAFPPGDPYLHEGRAPISETKYILSTYVVYT